MPKKTTFPDFSPNLINYSEPIINDSIWHLISQQFSFAQDTFSLRYLLHDTPTTWYCQSKLKFPSLLPEIRLDTVLSLKDDIFQIPTFSQLEETFSNYTKSNSKRVALILKRGKMCTQKKGKKRNENCNRDCERIFHVEIPKCLFPGYV